MNLKWSEIDPLDCETIELEHPRGWQDGSSDRDMLSERAKCLNEAQKEPFGRKLKYAEKIIRRSIEKGVKWSVSYSAGNDSSALSLLLIEHMGLNVDHVMSNTRMEDSLTIKNFGDRRKELQEKGVRIEFALPKKRPDEVWKENIPILSKYDSKWGRMYMTSKNEKTRQNALSKLSEKSKRVVLECAKHGIKISDKCCDELKKKPMKAWQKKNGVGGFFTGMRAEESSLRRMAYIQKGCLSSPNKSNKMWSCNPLMVWTQENVAEWLGIWGKEYRPTRNGCITCMYGAHLEDKENCLQRLKRENPRYYNKAVNEWGYGAVFEAFGIAESLDFYGYYHGTNAFEGKELEDAFDWLIQDVVDEKKIF